MHRACTVEVRGLVSSQVPGGARMVVARGRYTLRELSLHEYEFCGASGETFDLTLHDVAHYMRREIAVVEGRWPQGTPQIEMLVTRILGDCPGCARSDAFGNVDVFGSVLVRGCGYCEYRAEIPLPPIHKKIIYLDQSLYSHAFRGGDERFVEVADGIQAAALKAIAGSAALVHT